MDEAQESVWERFKAKLAGAGLPAPGEGDRTGTRSATDADMAALYSVPPSFVDRLPWVEFLPEHGAMLLDDGRSVAAFYELAPLATEGREASWLNKARDALEAALQDSFDEFDHNPWVVQFYAQDEPTFAEFLDKLVHYVKERAQGSQFTRTFLRIVAHHLKSVSKPGGFFEDRVVTKLPWRGQTRKVRLVVYRRVEEGGRRGTTPEQSLQTVCDRLTGSLASAGVRSKRMDAAAIHDWLLRWFNPRPSLIGDTPADRERFYALTSYPTEETPGEFELASGVDFVERLFFAEPTSDASNGTWVFDGMPHRVMTVERLRTPPVAGHITGELQKGGADATNAVFDQLPEGAVMMETIVITPQDVLEAHLNHLARKAVGDTIDSEQTRSDVQTARSLIGSAHKLYRGCIAFYLRGKNEAELDARGLQLGNALLAAGLQPVREADEVAPLNSYLRWLPCVYEPERDKHGWYTNLMFAQHQMSVSPAWGRSTGTGNPGLNFFNRGGGVSNFDPLSRLDRQMNGHMFIFGPTGSGKSATLNYLLSQILAIYRPRLFIVEAGNSFGLFGEFCARQGLTVHRVRLSPGAGVSLAPFADAARLIEQAGALRSVDVEDDAQEGDEQRDVLGELEITARLMITGGEEKEDARMTRADRSLIRQAIVDAAQVAQREKRVTLTHDVRDALRVRGSDASIPQVRRERLLEMADAMDIFCQGVDGEMFDRPGTPWPEADVTIVDLATFAREGYNAQLSIAYISLINTVNNLAERDQFLGRPIVNVTDEGHIITKNPLLAPYVVKITKMWRKLGAWFWLATQNLDDLPKSAEPMLNMIEWWVCLVMPPDEVEKIARFRELTLSQKAMMLSARKSSGQFSEGVVLGKSIEMLVRIVTPSLYLAMAMTEPEEKAERFRLMKAHGVSELDAAFLVAQELDRKRGIEPMDYDGLMAA
jgi:conjugative transfer ATPase